MDDNARLVQSNTRPNTVYVVQDYIEQESIENIDWSSRSPDFPICILGQVWCLIVSIPDVCPLSYFIAKNPCGTLFIDWFRVVLTHHGVFIGWSRHYEVFMN